MSKKAFKSIAKFAAPIAGSLLLPGVGTALGATITPTLGAAIGSGLGSLASGEGLKGALLSGAGSYVGSSIGGALTNNTFGSALGAGNVGPSFINPGFGSLLGETASNSIGAALANTNIGSALGSFIGSDLASNAFADDELQGAQSAGPANTGALAPFQPKQETEKQAPLSLSGLGGLTSAQQTSNLANQGTYGGGLGPQEEDYYLNMVNRRLVDQSGNVDADTSELLPIELSFLQKMGLGGMGSTASLLEAISKYGNRNPVYA